MKLTEKQKNCPYCHEYEEDGHAKMIDGSNFMGVGLRYDDFDEEWHIIYWNYDVEETAYAHIIACPMCGRPLNKGGRVND